MTADREKDSRRSDEARRPLSLVLGGPDGHYSTTDASDLGRIEQPWGVEVRFAHTERYGGRILWVNSGERVPLQDQGAKDETLYLATGQLRVSSGPSEHELAQAEAPPGYSWQVRPGEAHSFEALEESIVFAVSAPPVDEPFLTPDRSGGDAPRPVSHKASIRELSARDTHLAFSAMAALRDLTDEDSFVHRVNDLQRPAGYRLLAVFEQGSTAAVAIAGFRMMRSLALGDYLYVEDLVTLPAARRRGYARALLDLLIAECARMGIGQVHLDVPRDLPPPRSEWKRGRGGSGPLFPPGRHAPARGLCRRLGFEHVSDRFGMALTNATKARRS